MKPSDTFPPPNQRRSLNVYRRPRAAANANTTTNTTDGVRAHSSLTAGEMLEQALLVAEATSRLLKLHSLNEEGQPKNCPSSGPEDGSGGGKSKGGIGKDSHNNR